MHKLQIPPAPQDALTVTVKFLRGTPQGVAWDVLRTLCARYPSAEVEPVFPDLGDGDLETMFTVELASARDGTALLHEVRERRDIEFAQIAPDRRYA